MRNSCRVVNAVPVHIDEAECIRVTLAIIDCAAYVILEEALSLLHHINERQKETRAPLRLLPSQRIQLETHQADRLASLLHIGPVKQVVLTTSLVAQLSASRGLSARCAAHSLGLHTEASTLHFPAHMPSWAHQQTGSICLSNVRRYGAITVAPELLKLGQRLATDICLLDQHLMQVVLFFSV